MRQIFLSILLSLLFSCQKDTSEGRISIFWGKPVVSGDYQYVGALYLTNQDSFKLVCSASLIDGKFAVTAAHCIEKLLETIEEADLLGRLYYLSTNEAPAGANVLKEHPKSRKVDRYFIHPNRNNAPLGAHDIALIEFNQKLEESPSIKHIKNRVDWLQFQNFLPEHYHIAGFGLDENGSSGIKREATVSGKARLLNPYEIATPPGPDACQGDSGGPIFYKKELLGIASRGESCGNGGVFTLIHPYSCWINSVLKKPNVSPGICVDSPVTSNLSREIFSLLRTQKGQFLDLLKSTKRLNLMGLGINSLKALWFLGAVNPDLILDLRGNRIRSISLKDLILWQGRQLRLEANFIDSVDDSEIPHVPAQWNNWKDTRLFAACLSGNTQTLLRLFAFESCEDLNRYVYQSETLSFADTPLPSLDILEGLPNLETLIVENSRLTNAMNMPWLPNLQRVYLDHNFNDVDAWVEGQHFLGHVEVIKSVIDDAPLPNSNILDACNRQKARFFFTKVRNALPRPDLSCRTVSQYLQTTLRLDLAGASRIQFIDLLEPLRQLKSLNLAGTGVYDIGRLKALKSLEVLNLSHLNIDSLQVTERLTNLKKLILVETEIRVDSKKLFRKLQSRGVELVFK